MTEERVSPLRQRMIEDMRIRGMREKAQKAHIRAIKDFTAFLGRSPDTATPEDLRAYQLHMTDTGGTPSTFNVRIVALRFVFVMTCGREEMKRYMQFRTEPRKLPVVFSVEEGETRDSWLCPEGRHIKAVFTRRRVSAEKGICHMSETTITQLPYPSGFYPTH